MTQADDLKKDIKFLEWQINYFNSIGKDTKELEEKLYKARDFLSNLN